MAKPTQRDLARSGPRGGVSGGVSSGGLGGSDRPDDRDPVDGPEGASDPRTRLRTAGIFGTGRPGGGSGDPTKNEPGLVQQAVDALARIDKEFRAAVGADPFQESFRPDPRPPNDERPPRPALKPPDEEEPIVPGDADDLGARDRRRGARDAVNASPVLRRGLLGV